MLSVSTPSVAGDPSRGVFSREYDAAGRLVKEKYANTPTSPTDVKEVSYQLDKNGNVTKITYPDGYYVDKAYDRLNRLTTIKLNGSATPAASFVYDRLSRRTQMSFQNGVTTNYQFDLADRRMGMDVQFGGSPVPALASWRYGYNKVDQMTSQKFPDSTWEWRPAAASATAYGAANELNQIPTAGAATLSYLDGRGNLTSDGTWTFSYNTENMLTGATNGSVTISFDYDGENRQIRRTKGATKTRYVYSGDQLIAEYDDSSGALQRRYVYALGKDDPTLVVDATNAVTYLHADHLGSIIARTNASGVIVANGKYQYSPNGQSASLTDTTFGFTGQRFDSDLGLYHYKARYYSPALGRFLQADPVGYRVLYNLYPYANNDPLNLIDSNGREPEQGNLLGRTPYKSMDEAARGFFESTIPSSRLQGIEYSTNIFKDPKTGRFGHLEGETLGLDDVRAAGGAPRHGWVPDGMELVGHAHTHTGDGRIGTLEKDLDRMSTSATVLTRGAGAQLLESDNSKNNNRFSVRDRTVHLNTNVTEYVMGPSGSRGEKFDHITKSYSNFWGRPWTGASD